MLVPVAGDLKALELNRRNRTMPAMAKALNTVKVPPIYIFNIGPRSWAKGNGAQGRYEIPACEAGKPYSKPLVIDGLVLSEYDLGDGAGNMATAVDPGAEVASDIVGTRSTSAALDLFTTNLEWFGVFATVNEKPTKAELEAAREKLTRMMELIYAKGSELVQAGEKVNMLDRKNYNEAAEFLGRQPLWGSHEHALTACPWCAEPVREGAVICKSCKGVIDPERHAQLEATQKKSGKSN